MLTRGPVLVVRSIVTRVAIDGGVVCAGKRAAIAIVHSQEGSNSVPMVV